VPQEVLGLGRPCRDLLKPASAELPTSRIERAGKNEEFYRRLAVIRYLRLSEVTGAAPPIDRHVRRFTRIGRDLFRCLISIPLSSKNLPILAFP